MNDSGDLRVLNLSSNDPKRWPISQIVNIQFDFCYTFAAPTTLAGHGTMILLVYVAFVQEMEYMYDGKMVVFTGGHDEVSFYPRY